MNAEKIKNCLDIELLMDWQERIYRDCANINNCFIDICVKF